jgi:hypothetical protein
MRHAARQLRAWLIFDVRQNQSSLMKPPLKYFVTVIAAVAIAIAMAYGQQRTDAELRIARLEQAVEQFKKAPRAMEQVSPAQDRLLEQIVDEVIVLHRENMVLRKEIESLKSKR